MINKLLRVCIILYNRLSENLAISFLERKRRLAGTEMVPQKDSKNTIDKECEQREVLRKIQTKTNSWSESNKLLNQKVIDESSGTRNEER